MKDFWNTRYQENEYAYGILPNHFFKKELDKLPLGSILLSAEGEGRNAVYAAKKGWEVTAFDLSESGRTKALRLAESQKATISYEVTDALEFSSQRKFDVIALVYAHFPSQIRMQAHKHLLQFLKPKGHVIFEAFSKEQLGKASGGPQNEAMLFSLVEIEKEFPTLEFKTLKEETVELKEGKYHRGAASVIRFMGRLN